MLHELVNYAHNKGISAEPGFVPKVVRWLILFNARGDFLGVSDQRDPEDKRSKGREFKKSPHLKFSGDTPMRQFLVDTAEYALLFEQEHPSAKLLTKHGYFLNLLREAAVCEPAMGMIARRLADPACLAAIHAELAAASPRAKPADSVTFAIDEGERPRILVDESTWHDWWREFFPTLFEKKGKTGAGKGKKGGEGASGGGEAPETMRCFLTGKEVVPAKTHPKIKGLGDVGGNIETTLVGFNCDSFCSYGLAQSANAAVDATAAAEYAAALNELIARNSRRLAGAKVVFWYTGEAPVDPIALADNPDDFLPTAEGVEDDPEDDASPAAQKQKALMARDKAFALLAAISKGRSDFDLDDCRYCALTLSGNSGRVVVRDWMEGQFERLAGAVLQWFEDLRIVSRYGDGLAPDPKFNALLGGAFRELKDVPGPLAAALWRSALTGLPIPDTLCSKALAQLGVDIVKDNPISHGGMGLIKAAYIRKTGDAQMTAYLNEDHPEAAYHCGRLLALLGQLQSRAIPGVNAGVIQRYYAAASTTPALVLGRLTALSQHHISKLTKGEDGGLAVWLERQIADIWSRIKDVVPATLSLEQQTLFALGYYQQKASRKSGSEDTENEVDGDGNSEA